MEKKQQTPKFLRQRKFYMAMPVLIIPFLTLMFYGLGGGAATAQNTGADKQTGFNMNLPDAKFKDGKPQDKMGYYDQAQKDSIRLRELMENDPNFKGLPGGDIAGDSLRQDSIARGGLNRSPNNSGTPADPNEARVNAKLAELDAALKHNPDYEKKKQDEAVSSAGQDLDAVQMQAALEKSQGESEDPEMRQISQMLERIVDIQHPDRVREKLREESALRKGAVFGVSSGKDTDKISLLSSPRFAGTNNGFYGLNDGSFYDQQAMTIPAVVHETQVLVEGSIVKLRLTEDIFINGKLIPRNSFLFGVANLNGERLEINIESIRFQKSLFPVHLSVCDLDGMAGIYIPGAMGRDVAKNSADNAISGVGMTSIDGSFGAQAAGAGIEAARSLIGKKIKLIKVTVKAGYQVLLQQEDNR